MARRLAVGGGADALAALVEPERLDSEHLGDGETVVDLGHVDVARADSGVRVGLLGRRVGRGRLGEVGAVLQGEVVATLAGPGDGDGSIQAVFLGVSLAGEDGRRGAVGDGTGVVQAQRAGDGRRFERVLDGDLLLNLGVVVDQRVLVVLDRDVCQVLPRAAVGLEVRAGHQGVGAGEGHPRAHLVEVVGGDGQRVRRRRRPDVRHPLGPADDDDVGLAVAEFLDRRPNGRARGRTGGLEPGRRYVQADSLGHQRALVPLVFREFAHEVAVEQGLDVVRIDPGLVECFEPRLCEQVTAGAFGVFPELRDTGSRDTWV